MRASLTTAALLLLVSAVLRFSIDVPNDLLRAGACADIRKVLRELRDALGANGAYGLLIITSFSLINALSIAYAPYTYNFIRYVLGLSIALMDIYESVDTAIVAISQLPSGYLNDRLGPLRAAKYGIIGGACLMALAAFMMYADLSVPFILAVLIALGFM